MPFVSTETGSSLCTIIKYYQLLTIAFVHPPNLGMDEDHTVGLAEADIYWPKYIETPNFHSEHLRNAGLPLFSQPENLLIGGVLL